MSTFKIDLSKDELELVLDTLSFQFKYNYSTQVEELITKMDKKREEKDTEENSDLSFELYRTMVASSCHVTQEDFRALEYFPEIFSSHDHYYGTRIYLGDDLLHEVCNVNISEGLRMLILFAVSHNCRYLEIDSDGPKYDGFPEYDW